MKISQPTAGGGGGGGTIGGSIAATQIAYGSSVNAITGDANHTIDPTTGFINTIGTFVDPDVTGGIFQADITDLAGTFLRMTNSALNQETFIGANYDNGGSSFVSSFMAFSDNTDQIQSQSFVNHDGFGGFSIDNDTGAASAIDLRNTGIGRLGATGYIYIADTMGNNEVARFTPLTQSASAGDVNGISNRLKWVLDQSGSEFYVDGLQAPSTVLTGPTFSGSGLDDINTPADFAGTADTTYVITVSGLDGYQFSMSSLVGVPVLGDTVNDITTGAVGNIVKVNSPDTITLSGVTGGTFTSGDSVSGPGFTATVDMSSGPADLVDWTDGTNTGTFELMGISPSGVLRLSHSTTVNWDSGTGHTIGDQWTFTYTVGTDYGRMLDLKGQDQTVAIGDTQSILTNTQTSWDLANGFVFTKTNQYEIRSLLSDRWFSSDTTDGKTMIGDMDTHSNGTLFSLDDSSGTVYVATDTSFTVRNTAGNIVMYAQNDGGTHRFRAGDISGTFNGTFMDVDDASQSVKFVANTAFEVKNSSNYRVIAADLGGFNNITIGDVDNYDNGITFKVSDTSYRYEFNSPNFLVNSVIYSWPASQGASLTVLTNDGAGSLSWQPTGGSGVTNNVRFVASSTDTVLSNDYCVLIASPTGGTVESLPPALSAGQGKTYVFKDWHNGAGTNPITVLPDGSDTIDLASSESISVAGGSITIISDGISNWSVI